MQGRSSGTAAATDGFRVCGACLRRWPTAASMLTDPELSVVGLQVAAHLPEANLIVFEHHCGSSVSVRTSQLRFLLPDPAEGADWPDRWGSEECRQLCRRFEELAACDQACVNARDRDLLQVLLRIRAGRTD